MGVMGVFVGVMGVFVGGDGGLSLTSGVLLTAVCLIIEMCEKSPDTLTHFRKVRPALFYPRLPLCALLICTIVSRLFAFYVGGLFTCHISHLFTPTWLVYSHVALVVYWRPRWAV